MRNERTKNTQQHRVATCFPYSIQLAYKHSSAIHAHTNAYSSAADWAVTRDPFLK